ncbi:MAG: EamA family transporter, partial [Anaerolineae bacterium]|nr:EamA family transporter [Anaerolineae bacterium]
IVWYTGVKQVAGSIAAGFMGVMPVSALVLSYVLLDEAFRWVHILGFAIVISGVLLIANAHHREQRQKQQSPA